MGNNTDVRLLGWTDEEIKKLDEINVNWMIITDLTKRSKC